MNCFHDLKDVGVEEDRLGVKVVNILEVDAEDGLGVISWKKEEEGRWMATLETTGIFSESLSFTFFCWKDLLVVAS